jgi:methionyl-tRNA synthetase
MNVARLGNKYLADEEPWKEDNPERANTNVCSLQIAAALSSLCEPFLPLLLRNYREKVETRCLGAISETSDLIPAGQQIGEAELLLPKLKMKKFRNK